MARAGLSDITEAERVTRSVLLALIDVVSRDEVHDMASQLPKEMKDLMMGRLGHVGPVPEMGWGAFVERVL